MANNKSGIDKEKFMHLVTPEEMPDPVARSLAIAAMALSKKRTWNKQSYARHWLHVADVNNPRITEDEICIGLMHDVVEDSDWEISDLEVVGFNVHVLQGVDNLSKRPGEKYFDGVLRASTDPASCLRKRRDLEHNMDQTRSYTIQTNKQKHLYPVAHLYLQSVEEKVIAPNTPFWRALRTMEENTPHLKDKFLDKERVLVLSAETSESMPEDFKRRFNISDAEIATALAAKSKPKDPRP